MDPGDPYNLTPAPPEQGDQRTLGVVLVVLIVVGLGVLGFLLLQDDDDGSTADDAGSVLSPTPRESSEPTETTESPTPERPETTESQASELPTPTPASEMPDTLAGTWEGSVTQQSSATTYTVEMTLFPRNADEHVGRVTYPSLECEGYYTLESSDDDAVTVVEHITVGLENCVDGVEIVLTALDADRLSYTFEYAGNPEDGQGTLTRTE